MDVRDFTGNDDCFRAGLLKIVRAVVYVPVNDELHRITRPNMTQLERLSQLDAF